MKVPVKKLKYSPVKRGKPAGFASKMAVNQRKVLTVPVENSVEKVEISSETIRLDEFLKLCGCFGTGGMAKLAVQSGDVQLNGETCLQRGKKLSHGDRVTFDGRTYEVGSCGSEN